MGDGQSCSSGWGKAAPGRGKVNEHTMSKTLHQRSDMFGKEGRTCRFWYRGVEGCLMERLGHRHTKLGRPCMPSELTFPLWWGNQDLHFLYYINSYLYFFLRFPRTNFIAFPEIIILMEWHLLNSHHLLFSTYILSGFTWRVQVYILVYTF